METQRSHLRNQKSEWVLLPLLFPFVKIYLDDQNGVGWLLGTLGLGGVQTVQTNPSSASTRSLCREISYTHNAFRIDHEVPGRRHSLV